jgi:hypothetical protein
MAKHVFRGAQVVINSVDLSTYVSEVALSYNQNNPEATGVGDTTVDRVTGGLIDWSVTVTFFQDYSANGVEATLFGLIGNATKVDIELIPGTGTVAADNPRYHGRCVFNGYQPMGGSPGAVHSTGQATFSGAGTLTKDTS